MGANANEDEDIDTGADDETKDDDDAENSDDSGQDNDGANNDGDKTKVKDDDKSKKKDDADDDAAPHVRKTASDYYNERHARKSAPKADTQKNKDDDEDSDDNDVAEDDEEIISKVIDKRLAPVLEKIVGSEDKEEATNFFNENPEFKPYEAKIAKWWQDPSRRHLPISTVAYEAVGYKNLIKIGAQKQKDADEKAAQSKTKGSSTAQDGDSKPVADMSNKEFEAKRQEVLRRQAN